VSDHSNSTTTSIIRLLEETVVNAGICVGCGACIALDTSEASNMVDAPQGPIPVFAEKSSLPDFAVHACPGLGVNYPRVYKSHFGHFPKNWLSGHIENVHTGFSNDTKIRRVGASGGVLTQTLIHLLESGRVDAVILARQGIPTPEKAIAIIATTREEIIACSQSIYIPVSMLDIIRNLNPKKTYAITCLPEQSAALRVMQQNKFKLAQKIKYIIGPYTGTALYPAAIRCLLRSKRVKDDDDIISLNWRAGEWPGYLEIKTTSGKVIQTPKVYYNFLIPFFVTQTSLQSMDFANEFADLAVGDAWSPVFELQGGGHSIVVTRTPEMEAIISEMSELGLLELTAVDPLKASDMHGHMLDFKKRGGWLRNQWRRKTGRMAPDYGYAPAKVPLSRVIVEVFISSIFALGKTGFAQWLVSCIPESIIGPIFNNLRLGWKKASKPTKRKGLANFQVRIL
jgi:coenzyme F420 hydrogenase subunit beta